MIYPTVLGGIAHKILNLAVKIGIWEPSTITSLFPGRFRADFWNSSLNARHEELTQLELQKDAELKVAVENIRKNTEMQYLSQQLLFFMQTDEESELIQ